MNELLKLQNTYLESISTALYILETGTPRRAALARDRCLAQEPEGLALFAPRAVAHKPRSVVV